MGVWYLEKRRCRYYFRVRMPADLAKIIGKSHVVLSLGTESAAEAKIRAARFFSLFASFVETMRLRMECAHNLDGQGDSRLEMLVGDVFALGQAYQAQQVDLKSEFLAKLNDLIANFKLNAGVKGISSYPRSGCEDPSSSTSARDHHAARSGLIIQTAPSFRLGVPTSPAWTKLRKSFLDDKPGLTTKTIWSYNQAFDIWERLIGDKPINEIRRPDLKLFADVLRDKEKPRGGQLHHKSIQRSLGHLRAFMLWAVAAGHVEDDRFETVVGRDKTRAEAMDGERRRALTSGELDKLFKSPFFTKAADDGDVAAAWFLAIAALTGARTAEIALAPAKLILVGDIYCLDLRESGRKTSAAPRLIPLLPELINMGIVEWAQRCQAKSYLLVQPGIEHRTAAAWSKLLNRYMNRVVSDDTDVVLYSLRHSFRQMLRAGNIGDELADKIFGHSTAKVGARYGRELSPAEAQLFIKNVKPPVCLEHLWRRT